MEDKRQLFTEERELGSVKVEYMVSKSRGLNKESDAIDQERKKMAAKANDVLGKREMIQSSTSARKIISGRCHGPGGGDLCGEVGVGVSLIFRLPDLADLK